MLKPVIVFITLFLSAAFCFSQNKALDSLSQLLEKEKNNPIKLQLLNEMVDLAFQFDMNLAKTYAKQGVLLAIQTNDNVWQPQFYEMQGRMHANLLELDCVCIAIQELREKAKQELGTKFDLREFHNVALKNGSIPLDILETVVLRYITDTKPS